MPRVVPNYFAVRDLYAGKNLLQNFGGEQNGAEARGEPAHRLRAFAQAAAPGDERGDERGQNAEAEEVIHPPRLRFRRLCLKKADYVFGRSRHTISSRMMLAAAKS